MTPNKEPAIVLRSIRHGETSRILTLLSEQKGKMAVIAKGARKGKHGGTGGALSPPALIEAIVYVKASREVQILGAVNSVNNFNSLKSDLILSAYAAAVIELANKSTVDNEPNTALFRTVRNSLIELEGKPLKPQFTFWKFKLSLMQVSGIDFESNICPVCNTPGFNASRHNAVSFVEGGVCCSNCTPANGDSFNISGESLSIIRKLNGQDSKLHNRLKPSTSAETEISRLLENYLRYHIPALGKLPALKMLEKLNG